MTTTLHPRGTLRARFEGTEQEPSFCVGELDGLHPRGTLRARVEGAEQDAVLPCACAPHNGGRMTTTLRPRGTLRARFEGTEQETYVCAGDLDGLRLRGRLRARVEGAEQDAVLPCACALITEAA